MKKETTRYVTERYWGGGTLSDALRYAADQLEKEISRPPSAYVEALYTAYLNHEGWSVYVVWSE